MKQLAVIFWEFNKEQDQYIPCLVQNRNWSYDSQSADMEISLSLLCLTDVCSVHVATLGKCAEVRESEAE